MKESTVKISHAMQAIAQALDKTIEEIAGEPIAFSLIVYTEGRASYISTAPREVTVPELRGLLEHWESQTPDIPAHKYQD